MARRTIIETTSDLRREVRRRLGYDATATVLDRVVLAVQRDDHPPYGSDWSWWFDATDLWTMA